MSDIERLNRVHASAVHKPFGLDVHHNLEKSCKKMRTAIRKIGEMVGEKDEGKSIAQSIFPMKAPNLPNLPAIQDQNGGESSNCSAPQDQQSGAQGSAEEQIVLAADAAGDGASESCCAYKRKSCDSPLLIDLIRVVEYALILPPGTSKQKICRRDFPDVLRSNVLSKWTSRYFRFKLWKMDREVAASLRAIPNWWIEEQHLEDVAPPKGRDTIAGIPKSVAKLVEQAQSTCTMGNTDATKRADASQGSLQLRRSLTEAMDLYNQKTGELRQIIGESNQQAWQEFKTQVDEEKSNLAENEHVSKKKVGKLIKELKLKVKKVPKDFSGWKPNNNTVKRFNTAFRYRVRATNTSGNYLCYNDPRMIHARQSVRTLVKDNNIHWGLVLNLNMHYTYCFFLKFVAGVCHLKPPRTKTKVLLDFLSS